MLNGAARAGCIAVNVDVAASRSRFPRRERNTQKRVRPMDPRLIACLSVAVVLTITPGHDMALVTKNTLIHGMRAAWFTSLGVCTGLVVHASVSAAGLSVILLR